MGAALGAVLAGAQVRLSEETKVRIEAWFIGACMLIGAAALIGAILA